MNPMTGKTSGLPWWESDPALRVGAKPTAARARYVVRLAQRRGKLGVGKCPHAEWMRIRRLPVRVRVGIRRD